MSLSISIAPKYENGDDITSIVVRLVYGGLRGGLLRGSQGGNQGSNQSEHPSKIRSNTEKVQNVETDFMDNLLATASIKDDQGSLTVMKDDCHWVTDRAAQGPLSITYAVKPMREHDAYEEWNGILHKNADGVVGLGRTFIPAVSAEDTELSVSITWDFSGAPDGLRGVSSLGEGNLTKRVNFNDIMDCAFMIGKVSSYPPGTAQQSNEPGGLCSTYWLGDLPDNLSLMQDFSSNMFPHLSNFFKDERGSYRAFIRKVPKGMKGTPLSSAGLIDYDDDTKDESNWELTRLFNSTMIASYAQIDAEEDGNHNIWLEKGLSHLYTIYLPFRFKQCTPDYFRATLNGYMTAYYTNSLVAVSLDQLVTMKKTWHVESAIAMRSCIYMIQTDAFTRRSAKAREKGVVRPIDGIIAGICVRRRNGEKVRERDWIKYLGEWIGEEAAASHLQKMKDGIIMDFETLKTAFAGIVAEQQQVTEMGFDRDSLNTGVVKGSFAGSKAVEAGVRDGDKILWNSRPELCETDYQSKFQMKLERDGKDFDVEYWPRGSEMVKVWQSKKPE